ncbi:MAG: SDR family NAD(P)-dependent oxidoreductase [Devosia sp.]|nr:SDR family NAD(P)-dependent oxidoreductase [Devosia sp.]
MSLRPFEGQQVVVTGASRGIGRGIAAAFVAAGAKVRIIADDPAVAGTGAAIGAEARLADITDADAVAAALVDLDRIDVLVNNAGLERLTPVDGPSPETETVFRRIVDINVSGTFIVTRAALPKMQTGGRIINTASVWSRSAEPLFGGYVSSKHAVIGLTKTLAKELGPRGITVNAVCPGWVKTEASLRSLKAMSERSGRPEHELLDEIVATQALPGFMEPADVAGPYLFFASPWAANVTGQSLGVDRGEVPW